MCCDSWYLLLFAHGWDKALGTFRVFKVPVDPVCRVRQSVAINVDVETTSYALGTRYHATLYENLCQILPS